MTAWLTREIAREHFRKCGLSYERIHRYDIDLLRSLLGKEFWDSRSNPDSNDYVKPRMSKKTIFKRKDGRLIHAYLRMDGAYFKKRECISFNTDGFIGFAGWASDGNVQPVLRAFIRWCDILAGDS